MVKWYVRYIKSKEYNMNEKIKILLIGIGGYAFHYIDALLDESPNDVEIVGMVDPYPQGCKRYRELMAKNIPLYSTPKDFYSSHTADLAVISTPIRFHTEHILAALGGGSNVLCEKPLCADERDIERIIEARKKSGKFVDIGYQWSHDGGLLRLKSDIVNGIYGKPVKLKSITLWPRDSVYFKRGSGWAGKIYDIDGAPIYDSVANNATAHHLHNIFFLLGEDMHTAMPPKHFDAVLMRTNSIENFDTCVLHGQMSNGAELLYIASHAVKNSCGPICEYIFENGVIRMGSIDKNCEQPAHFVGYLNNGTVFDYGNPSSVLMQKLWLCIDAVRRKNTADEFCPVWAAAIHTKVINKLQTDFKIYPSRACLRRTHIDGEKEFTYAEGIEDALISIFKGEKDESSLYEFCEVK